MYEHAHKVLTGLQGTTVPKTIDKFLDYMDDVRLDGGCRPVAEMNGVMVVLDYFNGMFCLGVVADEQFVADGYYFNETGDMDTKTAQAITTAYVNAVREHGA